MATTLVGSSPAIGTGIPGWGSGGNIFAGLGYAQIAGEPYIQTTHFKGSATTWAHSAHPQMTIVELPASVVSGQITAHFRAAQWLATHS